jgi:hypothetical protein
MTARSGSSLSLHKLQFLENEKGSSLEFQQESQDALLSLGCFLKEFP